MGRIPEETIDQVVAATDIVDLINSYIPLKKAGSSYKCNCPFHNEKTPSFNVAPQKQAYYCFGCGVGGGAINFVMEYENLTFIDAVKKLAKAAGIPIIEDAHDPHADKRRRQRSRLLELHREAAAFFHHLLLRSPAADHARNYLKSRGFSANTATAWNLGWIPDEPGPFLTWAKEKGFKGRELIASGIAALKDENDPHRGLYLRFRDRLMFPIHNDYGDVIAFSGRVLQSGLPTGKYLNSPETALFNKSKTMFGLDRARRPIAQAKRVLICEGQLDVIACVEQGISYAIAPLGTAFTADHARMLKRYTDEAVLCFDSDSAGRKAVERAFRELVSAGIGVKVVDMPEGEDPDSLIQSEGVETFTRRIDGALDFFDFKLLHGRREFDLSDPTQRSELTRQIASLLAVISDPVALDTLVQKLSGQLTIGTSSLRDFINRARVEQARGQRSVQNSEAPTATQPTPLDSRCATLCKLALESPQAQQLLYDQIDTLVDASAFLPEMRLLQGILARRPDPSSSTAIQSCLSQFSPSDSMALQALLHQRAIPAPLDVLDEIMRKISVDALRYQSNQLEALLHEVSDAEEMSKILEEIKELQSSLKELGSSQ